MSANIEQTQPFFFNGLYGCYQPIPGHGRDAVAVLCNPFGDEYIRAHRAYRQLAIRLNRSGFPALRFDYTGTGDSQGDDLEASLTRWRTDINAAIDEAKRRAGVQKVYLAGLRLGASLAAQVAADRDDVQKVALWEPVVDGAAYLAELQEAHEHKLFYLASGGVTTAPAKPGQPSELLGFVLSDTMLNEIRAFDLLKIARKPSDSMLITEHEETELNRALRSRLESLGARLEYRLVDDPVIWAEDPDKALVPHNVLQAIVGWMSGVVNS